MAILFSGDFHANARGELSKITRDSLINHYGEELYNKIKYHIMLGDCGFMWHDYEEKDKKNYKELAKRDFPILCVMGNHEPVYGRKDLPEIDIGIGEKVIVVNEENPFVAYLKRGRIYNIEGYKTLVLGGALSADKERRVEGISWWKEEYWSEEEKQNLFELLKTENKFDFVVSHTGPSHINWELAAMGVPGRHGKEDDEVGELNEKIDKNIKHRAWFCGHWHYDYLDEAFLRNKRTRKKYYYIYKYTLLVDKNKLTVIKDWGEKKI
jgi:hypothetical protein